MWVGRGVRQKRAQRLSVEKSCTVASETLQEGVPETGAPEEEIEDWSQGPARIKAGSCPCGHEKRIMRWLGCVDLDRPL